MAMGLACRITRNKLGGVEKVEAPNGNDSILYSGALASTGNEERALGIWATAYTPDFMNYYGDWENPTPESMFNLDANGEPLLQDVAAYYTRRFTVHGGFTRKEWQDIKNSTRAAGLSNVEDLKRIVINTFLKPSGIVVTRKTLGESGLYEAHEIDRIINNEDVRRDVTSLLDKISRYNMNESYKLFSDFIPDFIYSTSPVQFIYKEGEYNSLGKQTVYPPEYIDMVLADNAESLREEPGYSSEKFEREAPKELVDEYNDNEEFSDYVMEMYADFSFVNEQTVVSDGITSDVYRPYNNLENFARYDSKNGVEVVSRAAELATVSEDWWMRNLEGVYKSLESIEDSCARMGIDMIGLKELSLNVEKTQGILQSLIGYIGYLRTGNGEFNVYDFAETLSVNNIGTDQRVEYLSPAWTVRRENLYHIQHPGDTRKLLDKSRLVQIDTNMFASFVRDVDLDSLYVRLAVYFADNTYFIPHWLNLSDSDLKNQESLKNALKHEAAKHVDYYNPEYAVVLRMLYGSEYAKFRTEPDYDLEYSKYLNKKKGNPVNHARDLYLRSLEAKKESGDEWYNLYAFLGFAPDGSVYIKGDYDAGTLVKESSELYGVSDMLKETLSLQNDGVYSQIFDDVEAFADDAPAAFFEDLYYDRPEILEAYNGSYNTNEDGTVSAKTFEPFINVNGVAYEMLYTSEEGGVYASIESTEEANTRKFRQTPHGKTGSKTDMPEGSYITEENPVSKEEKKRLDNELECK